MTPAEKHAWVSGWLAPTALWLAWEGWTATAIAAALLASLAHVRAREIARLRSEALDLPATGER